MSKTVKTRIQNKIDTSANWAKATNFTPLKGEIIIYSDLKKIKIGDGVTKVGALQFLADDNTHQSIKTLKTDNTTAQSPSSGETIAGSGTINLHKVSKTGSYNDLLNKPTIPSAYQLPIANASALGGVKSSTTGTTANRDYNVQVKADGTMKVNVPWTDTNTDTHYTAHMYAGAKDTQSNSATTNGNTYLKLVENGAMRDQHNIVGAGRTTVTSDANGKITISSTSPSSYTDTQIDNKDQAILTSAKGYVDGKPGINATGTVTRVKMNGTTKTPTNGTVDLGTVITAHQDISGKQDKLSGTGSYIVGTLNAGTINGMILQKNGVNVLNETEVAAKVDVVVYINYNDQQTLTSNELTKLQNKNCNIIYTNQSGKKFIFKPLGDFEGILKYYSFYNDIIQNINIYTNNASWDIHTFTLQEKLVSGTNIKTINGNSILGSGNVSISASIPDQVAKLVSSGPSFADIQRYGSSSYRVYIQHGTITIGTSNKVTNKHVTFTNTFPGVPTVTVTVCGDSTQEREVNCHIVETSSYKVTTSGFYVSAFFSNTSIKMTSIKYIAIYSV